jgi:hypothetical protein
MSHVQAIPAVIYRAHGDSRRRLTELAAYKDAAGNLWRAGHCIDCDAFGRGKCAGCGGSAIETEEEKVRTILRLARLLFRIDNGRWPGWVVERKWWRR